jgi:exodeoxyribonuclease VII large subunit
VQGETAAVEVRAGIRHFNQARNVDVIVVARGGGSAEDLAAFNDEALARAVAASEIPVVSAVGHETDFTIIDFVADLRAPTPSAAAEMVIRSRQDIEEQVRSLQQRLEKGLRYHLLRVRQSLTELAQHGAFGRMMDLIHRGQQRLDDLGYRLAHAERDALEGCRRRLEILSGAIRHYDARRILAGMGKELDARTAVIVAATRELLRQRRARFEHFQGQLEALSPTAILERGYALVFDSSGKLLLDAGRVSSGDEISARVARGTLIAIVKRTV